MTGEGTNSNRRFRLLGHRFEVRTPLSVDKAKATLRQRKIGWLNPKRGPRGYILGSVLCLQWSALAERTGAVVLARIADDGMGSRVYGRAGPDLGSLALIGVIAGLMIFLMYQWALGGADLETILLFSALFLLIPGAVLCLRLLSPEDPEPLVRFIQQVLEAPTVRSSRSAPTHFDRTPVQSAKLNLNGRHLAAPSEHDVAQAIFAMKADSFLIVDFGSNRFMQTALEYDRFILEKCEGSDRELYRAEGEFETSGVVAAMTAYLRGSQPSEQIVWEKVRG